MPTTSHQRFIAILIYLLPWSDTIPFGRYLFTDLPFLEWLILPALPLIILEKAIPFGGILIFFGLFFGIIRNNELPYSIRFNALQALLIDIILILLNYAFQIILAPMGETILTRTVSSAILIGVLSTTIFCIIECCKGKQPDLPWISEAVKMQIF